MQEDIKERTAVETMKDNIDIQKQHDIHTYTHTTKCAMTSAKKILSFVCFFCVLYQIIIWKILWPCPYCDFSNQTWNTFFFCFLNYLKQKQRRIAITQIQKTI